MRDRLCLACALTVLVATANAQQNPAHLYSPGTARTIDRFVPLPPGAVRLTGGLLGARFEANERNRLIEVDENDLLDAFERRNVPHQDWQGEHVGKFLHAATLTWANTHNAELKRKIDRVAKRLLATQMSDGYLGTYPDRKRWTAWDVWVQKYVLLGLLTYYQYTGDRRVLTASEGVGDLLVRTFGHGPGQRDINSSGEHVGMAATSVLEPVVLLYRATNDRRYLDFARYIVSNYDSAQGPHLLTALEATHSVAKVADAKAYEMLSNFNGLAELYRATGEPRLLSDLLLAWNDIVKNRLYITGSGSNYETWTNGDLLNDQKLDANETCVTVSWEQQNLQLFRVTGRAEFADEAERTVYNQLLGAQRPDGAEWDYYTSLDGVKPYTDKTNCCLSSGPRGVALLPSIAYMKSRDGALVVNLYNQSEATADLPGGRVVVRQRTAYPVSGTVRIEVDPVGKPFRFPLMLRKPSWSSAYRLWIDGRPTDTRVADGYLRIDRIWKRGSVVRLDLPVTVRPVRGTGLNQGRVAFTYGPLVLAFDGRINPGEPAPNDFRLVAGTAPRVRFPASRGPGEIEFLASAIRESDGATIQIRLTPFAFAGRDGISRYAVWLKEAVPLIDPFGHHLEIGDELSDGS